jgi:hypothetical protein
MPVIPFPDNILPSSPPPADLSTEIGIQRNLTSWFISQDPTSISLVPAVEVETPSGGRLKTAGTPRSAQTFKLIQMSHTERPTTSATEDEGVQREHDFTLLGEYNAIVEVGDSWEDPAGQVWVVDSIVPYNGYEVKALITSYGDKA